jgi:hypothetical protein
MRKPPWLLPAKRVRDLLPSLVADIREAITEHGAVTFELCLVDSVGYPRSTPVRRWTVTLVDSAPKTMTLLFYEPLDQPHAIRVVGIKTRPASRRRLRTSVRWHLVADHGRGYWRDEWRILAPPILDAHQATILAQWRNDKKGLTADRLMLAELASCAMKDVGPRLVDRYVIHQEYLYCLHHVRPHSAADWSLRGVFLAPLDDDRKPCWLRYYILQYAHTYEQDSDFPNQVTREAAEYALSYYPDSFSNAVNTMVSLPMKVRALSEINALDKIRLRHYPNPIEARFARRVRDLWEHGYR